jgi:cytochrome c-type biogenesis protein CcmI
MRRGFLAVATAMLTVALLLIFTPLLRAIHRILRRLRESRAELRALDDARSAGSLEATDYASRRAALGERLLSILDAGPTRVRATLYGGLAVAVLVPLAAMGTYRSLGSPQMLGAPATLSGDTPTPMPMLDHGTDMQAAIAKLADKLRQHPDDAQGWALLGRTYKATQHYSEAREAFKHALDATPGDEDLKREYAAAETPDAESADTPPQPQQCPVSEGAAECAEPSVAPGDSTHVVVKVALDPKLKESVRPNDTLFVFAKAADGPSMPLAIARLTAAQLPASVTLTDAMAMVPSMTLSRFPQIVVGARISKSGNAIAQSGDLQTVSATMTVQAEPVQLIIAQRVD